MIGAIMAIMKGFVAAIALFFLTMLMLKGCMGLVYGHVPIEVRRSNDRTISGIAWPHSRIPEVRIVNDFEPQVIVIELPDASPQQTSRCHSRNRMSIAMENYIKRVQKEDPERAHLYKDTLKSIKESYCDY